MSFIFVLLDAMSAHSCNISFLSCHLTDLTEEWMGASVWIVGLIAEDRET